jgi:hypothetical protein
MLLMSGCAVGFVVAEWLTAHDEQTKLLHEPWFSDITAFEHVVYGVVVGTLLAGPLVIVAQAFRGRRCRPSLGEWCWLLPIVLYLALLVTNHSLVLMPLPSGFRLRSFYVWLSVQFLISVGGGVVLFGCSIAARRHIRQWTDPFGAAVCVSVWLLLWYDLTAHPLYL